MTQARSRRIRTNMKSNEYEADEREKKKKKTDDQESTKDGLRENLENSENWRGNSPIYRQKFWEYQTA